MLEFLKAAAALSIRSDGREIPDDQLCFTLEYAFAPDVPAERDRIAHLLEGDGFTLFSYGDEDPDLLILTFPGLDIEQSPDYLFEVAEELRAALDLVSVTPETGALYSDSLSTARAPESLGWVINRICLSGAESPPDPNWAVRMIRADVAARRFGVTGAGVRVAQPDTGVADHRELDGGAVEMRLGYNYVDGIQDPTDPLSTRMASPGHGTGTASVVVSRAQGRIAGSAPGAVLVPIRTVNSVVIGSGTAVAKAVDHARLNGCRIVTMSLGGPFAGRALRRAIERAVAADLIVLAAAGNCVVDVVYPAWDANVIAVAGVDEHGNRWRGSCRGPAVDIAAPAENVHVARRKPGQMPQPGDLEQIDPRGQGTSFAVALTAGVAALWVERFGFDAIRAEARRRGLTVHALFRAALRASADAPAGWDHGNMGAGIVDAERLLSLDLPAIPHPAPVAGDSPALVELGIPALDPSLEPEASFVAADWAFRRNAAPNGILERALPARPSARLARLITAPPPENQPAPAVILSPATPPVPVAEALRRVSAGLSSGLESAPSVETALDRLRQEGARPILDLAEQAFARRAERRPDLVEKDAQAKAIAAIAPLVRNLTRPEGLDEVPPASTRYMLEALVKLTGRPAIRIRGDGGELDDPEIGDWTGPLMMKREKWQRLTQATGRIDVLSHEGKWVHAGTGFLIADGQVMTNRHVIDVFAESLPMPPGQQRFAMRRDVSIIFDPDARDDRHRFRISGVLSAGRTRIGRYVDLSRLDMAVLELDAASGTDRPPLPIDRKPGTMADADYSKLLLTGYPAEPDAASGPDGQSDREARLQFWDRIGALYGEEYGVQYMSPGMVELRPGQVPGDPNGWVFTHDATTMRGNSGSAVIALHGDRPFCGLHFGGETLTQNFAHDISRVIATGDGVFRRELLEEGL